MSERKISTCRGCGAPVIWATTADRRPMPLDAVPTDRTGPGIYVFTGERDQIREHQPLFDESLHRYLTHFATCPKSREFSGNGITTPPRKR